MSKPLNAFDTVCASRMAVYKRLPYFSKMLWKLAPVERPGIGTFAVDDKLRVHYDPELALAWGVETCATIMAHEVQHPLREHVARFRAFEEEHRARYEACREGLAAIHPLLGQGVPVFWNVVGDMEINPVVIEAGFKFPEGFKPFFPKTLGMKDGLFSEEYADELMARAEKAAKQPQQQGGKGKGQQDAQGQAGSSGGGGQAGGEQRGAGGGGADAAQPPPPGSAPAAGECAPQGGPVHSGGGAPGAAPLPAPRPTEGACGSCAGNHHPCEGSVDEATAPEGVSEASVEIARRQVAHDTLEPTEEMKRLMGQFGIGQVPGSLERWAKAQLAPPEVPWQKVLAPLVRRAVSYARGRVDWKFGRPSRRREALKQTLGNEAPLLPTLVAPIPSVGIVVDTSGSMSAQGKSGRTLLNEALSEVVGIVLATGSPCWAAAVDADVQGWVKVRSKRDADALVKGGGGTDMRVGIKAAEAKKFDVIVLVTDGYTPWPTRAQMPKRSRLVTCIVGEAEAPAHLRPLVRVQARGKKEKAA